jgi:hypothetical protein
VIAYRGTIKDPEELTGAREEKLEALREIRNQIKEKLTGWLKTIL